MRYGNCVIYAVSRFFRKGGYLCLGWSPRNLFVPHFFHTDSLENVVVNEFIPDNPRSSFLGVLKSPFFKGHVRTRRMPGPDETLTGGRP